MGLILVAAEKGGDKFGAVAIPPALEPNAKQEIFHLAKREAQKNACSLTCDCESLQTGKLFQTRKAMQRAYGQAFNAEELVMYDYVIANVSKLVFERFSPLGEVKDLTDPKDIKNIQNKRKRGVTGYNIYSFKHNAIFWQVKTEVFNNSVEAIYHIMKKK